MFYSGETILPTQTISTRYRGEYADAIVAQTPGELDLASTVLISGLEALKEATATEIPSPEYTGCAFIYYPEPDQELGFNNPEVAIALSAAFQAAGLEPRDPTKDSDDYIVREGHCLDFLATPDDYFPTVGVLGASYLVAPVVRGTSDQFSPRDEHEQYRHIRIKHDAAVRFSGFTLIEGIVQYDPDVDAHRIPAKTIAGYLNSLINSSGNQAD